MLPRAVGTFYPGRNLFTYVLADPSEHREKDFTPEFVSSCRARAAAADAEGQALYGWALVNGWGVESDPDAGYKFLLKAAETGSAIGQTALGLCYNKGIGVSVDTKMAREWYSKAAKHGYARALNNLGVVGGWAPQNETFGKASVLGLGEGSVNMGVACYGPSENDFEAGCYFAEGARRGSAAGQFYYGCFVAGYAKWDFDMTKAIDWWLKAAEQGHAGAMRELADCFVEGKYAGRDIAKAMEFYRSAAERGDAIAQNRLGMYIEDGVFVERNSAMAVELYLKAAKQGLGGAKYNLGRCYEFGIGVEKDIAKAVEWYKEGSGLGSGFDKAYYNLGHCYEYGNGVEKDLVKAVELYKSAAHDGNAFAQFALARCCEFEKGLASSPSYASYYFHAADQGHSGAQFAFARCCVEGNGRRDAEKDIFWFKMPFSEGGWDIGVHKSKGCLSFSQLFSNVYKIFKTKSYKVIRNKTGGRIGKGMSKTVERYHAAAERGCAAAQFELGMCYHRGEGGEKDMAQAVRWYVKAAEQGYAGVSFHLFEYDHRAAEMEKDKEKVFRACKRNPSLCVEDSFVLGVCYHRGDGVEKDMEQAIKWYRKAAEKGYAPAQYELGECYYKGEGVEKDMWEAFEWYHLAAENGYAGAIYKVGMWFYRSNDFVKAFEWYRSVAEQGFAHGQYMLGKFYAMGEGVEKDVTEAVKWYQKAAAQGDENAIAALQNLGV